MLKTWFNSLNQKSKSVINLKRKWIEYILIQIKKIKYFFLQSRFELATLAENFTQVSVQQYMGRFIICIKIMSVFNKQNKNILR